MTTRVYFPLAGTAGSSPTPDTGWARSIASFARFPASTTKANTAAAYRGGYPGVTTTDLTCFTQHVFDPLDVDQTITGTFSAVTTCYEGVTNTADHYLAIGIRVMQGDTDTVRGVLYAPTVADTEFPVGPNGYSRIFNAAALSSVNALAGDRIVVEWGTRGNTPPSNEYAYILLGDPTSSDLALTSAVVITTPPGCPWLEFSQTITFAAPAEVIAVGQASETDTAQAITLPAPTVVAVGQGSETDTAQAITKVLGAVTIAVNQATETDLARPIAVSQGVIIAIGQATESDLAQSIAVYATATIALGQATEIDLAQIILLAGASQTISVGQATETDTAQTISSPTPITIAVGQASEIELALAITLVNTLTGTLGQASETDLARAITVVFGLTETWSINLKHPTTGLALTGLGNSVVKFEAYQESTGDWFNSATNALQAAQPTPLALLEDVSGEHDGRYAGAATIGVFDDWMVLHIYWDYDASDGRGTVRRHAWSRVRYVAGVEWLGGMTVAQDTTLSAVPTAAEIIAADAARLVDGAITRAEQERMELAETLGNATVPAGAGTYAFKGQDGTTVRVGGTIDADGVRTVTTVNGAP